eukprot:m.105833 g.105833  ORF g.105833 m.105833 type:complete len:382 (+) comp27681_c0_seq1:204-1349(+)
MACNTTFVFKFNCGREMQTCPFCNMVYCKHHASPSHTIGKIIGGHHCPNFTKGATVAQYSESMIKGIGSMMGDFASLDQTHIDKMNSVTEQIQCLGLKNTRDCGEVVLGILAEMACRVYDVGAKHQRIKDVAPSGWSIAHQEPQGPLQPVVRSNGTQNNDGLINGLPAIVPSTLSMAVYTNTAQKLAVVAIRGHVVGDASHAMFHLLSVVRGQFPDSQLLAAVHLVKRWQDKGYVVVITGHSFGGYLAELVATHVGLAGAGFNAPNTGWHAGHQLKASSNSQRYVNVYVKGDGQAEASKSYLWTYSNIGHSKITLKNTSNDNPNKITTTIAMINAQVPHATNACIKDVTTESAQGNETSLTALGGYYNDVLKRYRTLNITT